MSPLPLPYIQSDIANSDSQRHVQSQAWMLTFADLLSLLLTFFVLIFSMNSVQKEEWQEVVQSLTKEFNPARAQSVNIPEKGVDATRVFRSSALSLEYMMAVLRPHLNASAYSDAHMRLKHDRLVISFSTQSFFEGMELTADATSLVTTLSDVFRQMGNEIRVGVHADPTLLPAEQLLNKREYTVMQSLGVTDAFYEAGYRTPITALGYGDARFREWDEELRIVELYGRANRVQISIMDRSVRETVAGE